MKKRVQNVIRPPEGAITAGTIAIHIPQHNDERVPVPILPAMHLLVPEDVPDSRCRPVGRILTAHSRRHCIAEGSREGTAPTSLQLELWSLNMARANFDELLSSFEGFLCQGRLQQWTTG